jgi:DNA polymerase/3'-5' exonuclease PolX
VIALEHIIQSAQNEPRCIVNISNYFFVLEHIAMSTKKIPLKQKTKLTQKLKTKRIAKKIARIKKEPPKLEPHVEALTEFYGIGPIMAKDYIKNGIAGHMLDFTMPLRAQLTKLLEDPAVLEKLTDATKADLMYNPTRQIPNQIIKEIDNLLHKHLKGFRFDIAGSYRRNKPVSRDIDIIVSSPSSKTTAQHWEIFLSKVPEQIQFMVPYAQGEDKVSTMLKYKNYTCKVDVFFTDPKEYMYMLLYATGSGQFNIRMRSIAKRKGYLLNQRGLYKKISPVILEKVPVKNEKHLFKILGIKWLEPHERLK